MLFNVSSVNEYLGLVLNVVAVAAILYAVLCFFSDDARVKLHKIRQRLQEVKNLEEKHIDDFRFGGLQDPGVPQGINKNTSAAGTRTLYSSNPKNSQQYIKASSDDGKLILEYGFSEQNSDCWVSYVIQGNSQFR